MDELLVVHVVSLWGFGIAVAFGMIANKTQFCTMGALSDWVNFGSLTRFRAWLLAMAVAIALSQAMHCLLYTSPSPRDRSLSRMPSSA